MENNTVNREREEFEEYLKTAPKAARLAVVALLASGEPKTDISPEEWERLRRDLIDSERDYYTKKDCEDAIRIMLETPLTAAMEWHDKALVILREEFLAPLSA